MSIPWFFLGMADVGAGLGFMGKALANVDQVM